MQNEDRGGNIENHGGEVLKCKNKKKLCASQNHKISHWIKHTDRIKFYLTTYSGNSFKDT